MEILCYCIIDEQSNACFMSEELREQLECSSSTTDLTLSALYKSKAVIFAQKVENLEILNFVRDGWINLTPDTQECIPASASQISKLHN